MELSFKAVQGVFPWSATLSIRRHEGERRRSAKRRVSNHGTVDGTVGETSPVRSAGGRVRRFEQDVNVRFSVVRCGVVLSFA